MLYFSKRVSRCRAKVREHTAIELGNLIGQSQGPPRIVSRENHRSSVLSHIPNQRVHEIGSVLVKTVVRLVQKPKPGLEEQKAG